ncbi:M48 family metalloprotease [Granulosicoccus sp. 3-233]|uniref:M48 family metalloprotease n=1 Tax=Granulosicoccus sp. 3-233 TaxID=3417969 RepID=UPI003D337FE1
MAKLLEPVTAGLAAARRLRRPGMMSLVSVLLLSACVQNPVTGKKDFLLVSEDWELQVGAQQYLPLRQAQGGDYVVDPGVEAYVQSVGQRLAAQSDRKLPYEFHVINDSSANAWALPGGKISINRGLLVQLQNESELAAVLGHEIVHAAAKHGARGQTRGIGLQLGVLTATVLGGREGYGQQAQVLSSVGAQLINSQYGQGAELEADRYGMTYMDRAGYDPQGAVELQRTFVKLSEGRPTDAFSRLFASHPPSEKRVQQNMATARTLGQGGDLGEREYQAAIAPLMRSRKAYEAFDKAQLAFQKKDTASATKLLRAAIRIEPREAHFHSLAGDIALSQKNLSSAKRSFDKAISLNDEFYYYYLQRGRINELQNNARAAQADYANSVKLLPTSAAQLSLGQYAERAGKEDVAKRYYAMAAQAQGADADKARAALMKLDPPVTQQTRLLVRQGLTSRGTFAVELINQTSRNIAGVQLGISAGEGTPQQVMMVRQAIPAGQSRVVDTGRRLTRPQSERMLVRILDARIQR